MLILCFTTYAGLAQKFELGKVSIAELQEKEHPKDASAVAAVLFEKGQEKIEYSQVDQAFQMIFEENVRIKIYKKEGYNWANKTFRYYTLGSDKEKIYVSDAATYNLVDGKIEKTKLKSDGEFDENINKYFMNKKITMPNVKEGSVIEFSIKVISPFLSKMHDWNFQTSIPVNYSEFKTYVPEYFVYNANQKGFIFPKMSVEKREQSINFTIKERTSGTVASTSFSNERVTYEETCTSYLAQNMPAMKEELYVNNINNYSSGISHELSMTKLPGKPYKTFSTDWATVTREIYKNDDFGSELDKTGYFEQDVAKIIEGLTDRTAIIAAIFDHVKSSVKWNEYNGYTCETGVKSAYKKKDGNVAEINLMLTAMLRYAGIEANPVLLSTRANGISFFPNRTAFNYVISAVETPNGFLLLDATDKYAVPNVLPERDLNWVGRLIRKDGSSEQIDLMPKSLSREINYVSATLGADGAIVGKIRTQMTDYEAFQYRKKAVGTNKDSFVEALENEKKSIEISEYVRDNDTDLSKPLIESYTFKDAQGVEIINNKIYVAPLLFMNNTENPFKQEKREYPVDFGYPKEVKFNVSIEIPSGYKIESLPKPINLVTGDDIGAFKYSIVASDNKIQILIVSTMTYAVIPADYYDILKDFYQKMLEKQNEKIILVKA